MMAKTLVDKLTETPEGRRLYQQERAIEGLAHLIREVLDSQGVGAAELARRLRAIGCPEDMLFDEDSPDIRAIADIFTALGRELRFEVVPLGKRE